MDDNLFIICIWAFAAVIALLSFLALLMRILIQIFPEKSGSEDAAVVTAISSVVASATGGGRVVKIEETKRS